MSMKVIGRCMHEIGGMDIREKWAWHGHARVGRNGFGWYLGNVMKGAWCGDEREKVVRKKNEGLERGMGLRGV